ncbi:hypothetical protein DPEC_G00121700 [Dallia pectoralis]|uniref:Uncharacterized protein n=1 Tax=Dallia pectoralis TaxID=75939 RepID=A0ACC2GQ59_DALPE|nr:hypothetical protein DPEC_G00121700 [Dallia pectoralis]
MYGEVSTDWSPDLSIFQKAGSCVKSSFGSNLRLSARWRNGEGFSLASSKEEHDLDYLAKGGTLCKLHLALTEDSPVEDEQ